MMILQQDAFILAFSFDLRQNGFKLADVRCQMGTLHWRSRFFVFFQPDAGAEQAHSQKN